MRGAGPPDQEEGGKSMDLVILIGLAAVTFGAGFAVSAVMTAGRVDDLHDEIAELEAELGPLRAQEHRRAEQRAAALARAQEINRTRQAAKA